MKVKINKLAAFWRSLQLFVFAIPFPQLLSIRILLGVLVFSFFIRNKKSWFTKFFLQSWDLLFYLLLLIAGLLYSEELLPGWRVIETSLSLLALPLVFMKFKKFDKRSLHALFYAFALGLFVACSICLTNACLAYFRDYKVDVFFSDRLTEIIGSHPTYLAYYLIAVVTFGLYLLYYEPLPFSPVVLVSGILFFFLMLILTGGLTAFISVLLIFSFFILKYLLEERKEMQTMTFVVVTLMIVCMFVFNNINGEEKNDYWERFGLWESAINATPNVLLGVGTGDYKKVLNDYYVSHRLFEFARSGFNSHNQFIEMFFSNGLIGVMGLLFMMGRPLYLSVRNQNLLGTLIFFPFIIYGMTEVFLGRYQGVVFFGLFHQAFVTHYQAHERSFSLKDV